MRLATEPVTFIRLAWRKRALVYEMARRDFTARYLGTYLGMAWAFIHPLTYVAVLWAVFTLGLRANPAGRVPFVAFLISGMIAWQFFSSSLQSLTGVVRAHDYLVKKGDFSLSLLHLAGLMSAAIPHLLLIATAAVVCWSQGFAPGLHTLQILYYLPAMLLLLLGLGWITSSLSLFVEDVANVVTVLMQLGFWLTPIVWSPDVVPVRWRWMVRLNPAAYIVQGYRDSLVTGEPFWSRPLDAVGFWAVAVPALLGGAVVFRRVKPHFGEVV